MNRELLQEAVHYLGFLNTEGTQDLIARISAALAEPEPDAMEILRQVREERVADECRNCGAVEGLHRADTNQCPLHGQEATFGKIQQWLESVYEPRILPKLPDSEAASLIADFGKRVPRAMLEEVWIHGHDYAFDKTISANIDKIIEKFGYRAE